MPSGVIHKGGGDKLMRALELICSFTRPNFSDSGEGQEFADLWIPLYDLRIFPLQNVDSSSMDSWDPLRDDFKNNKFVDQNNRRVSFLIFIPST